MTPPRKQRRRSKAEREAEEWSKQAAREAAEREAELAEREAERRAVEAGREARVTERVESLRIEHEARKQLAAEVMRQREFKLPEPGWTAADFLKEDDSDLVEVVEGLHFAGNNTLLVAEFKAGKTTLEVNLAAALADGKKFLGRFQTKLHGRIAILNYEMAPDQFRLWLRQSGVKNADRIVPLNLRGWHLPFWNEDEMLRLAEWLLANEVEFIILDPAARAWRGLVENESDNIQLGEFFGSLDELKRLANVPNLLIAAHTPRSAGDARARGGGEIEAWPDGNWYIAKEKNGVRSLKAEGRDILLDPVALDFDDETKVLTAAGSVDDMTREMDIMVAVNVIQSHGEFPSQSQFMKAVKGMSSDRKSAAIEEAVERGLILTEENGRATIHKPA